MDVSKYPTSNFVLTSPITISSLTVGGGTKTFSATGNLTMHGVTKTVKFNVSVERLSMTVKVLADIAITFSR